MSYMLPHLHNGWQVDQAILSEEDRVLVIRFGHDWDPTCMKMDEVLYSIAEKVKNFAVIYLVDITEVPDFNKMYELYDPCTVMFFFRNKHIMIDLGTGNNNKINWTMEDKQEMIDIVRPCTEEPERDEVWWCPLRIILQNTDIDSYFFSSHLFKDVFFPSEAFCDTTQTTSYRSFSTFLFPPAKQDKCS
uniref:Thioredoxin-like protein 4A n=1 Tax=Scophthalmus maximus TaxID=52904 RepID=A0A8D3EEF0_SCOMX